MKKRKLIKLFVSFFVVSAGYFCHGQQKELDSLVHKFDHHRTNSLQEKLYVHIDRSFFLTGETMWFKIYSVDGTFHKPIDMSKVAYLELLDKTNAPVLQSKIAMKDGWGSGSLFIPATIPSGNYLVRVYTHWMKNFSPEFYFQKMITVVNPFVKMDQEKTTNPESHHLEFFPEGGNLVAGLESKVAFKATNLSGKGITFKGSIINHGSDTTATFEPDRFGMGTFTFTPNATAKYTAVIRDTSGAISTHPLPRVYENGLVMNVASVDEKNLTVKVTGRLPETQAPLVYLFVHTRQKIVKAEAKLLRDDAATFTLSKDELGEGISHITIFNSEQQPVCERLYFKQPEKNLAINVSTEQQDYGIRRKAKLSIQAHAKQLSTSNLSVSIYKIDSLESNTKENIYSYLWLASDLKEPVESPAFYVDPENKDAQKHIDDLMLTHGWRRFKWEEVMTRTTDRPFIPEYRGHIIHGHVYTAEEKPQSGILTYLSSPGKNIWLYGSRSNTRGEIVFEVKNFYGPRQIVLQTNGTRDTTQTIRIRSPFSDQFSNFTLPPFWIDSRLEKLLLSRSIAMQVQDIYYEQENSRTVSHATDSLSFFGKPDETYFLDNYTRFPVMEEVMREYVPGVLVRKRRDGFHFLVLDKINGGILQDSPMVLLDGVPVFNTNKIMAYDPLKVKKLEVVARKYYIGSLYLPGIVSYTTYDTDLNGFELDPRSVLINYEGLQLQREFYMPKYENQKQRTVRMPDQRTLLYWAPEVRVDENGQHELEFFTSDVPGRYQVVVEGLNAEGYSGSGTHTFSVRRFD